MVYRLVQPGSMTSRAEGFFVKSAPLEKGNKRPLKKKIIKKNSGNNLRRNKLIY